MRQGINHLDLSVRQIVQGDIEAGIVNSKEAKVEVAAGAALVQTGDELLESLIELVLT